MGTAARSERSQAMLRHARRSLRAEWAFWTEEAGWPARVGQPALEKHQSQIQSVVTMLEASLAAVTAEAAATPDEDILDLHHVWDFFRVKLALRYIGPLRGFLDTADELAWNVYEPAVAAVRGAGPVLREPPLVFLGRDVIPFASPRGSSYRDLLPRGGIRTQAGADAARSLPFPVIGLPWYLTGHLPGVLFVAHEAGHHIEEDAALAGGVLERLSGAGLPGPSQDRWRPWLGEVFADLVASIACGVAYPAVLADALAAAPPGGAGEESYPPPRVRVEACRAALRYSGLPADAAGAAWDDVPGEPDTAEREAAAVIQAILGGSYDQLGKRTLGAVLSSPAVAGAERGAGQLLVGVTSDQPDPRGVLAAASLAFIRSPEGYDRFSVGESAIREVLRLVPDGPRAAGDVGDERARRDRDRAAGRALAEFIRG